MPCYLFTYHAYGSWLPDHPRGYVHRGDGMLPPDDHMAELYRNNLKQAIVTVDRRVQRLLIEGSLDACKCQQLRRHFIATEPTHVHVLASWTTDRKWQIVRRQIRGSITRQLNAEIRRQEWFSKSPSRKRVKDLRHFNYLTTDYLVKHGGLKWKEGRGIFLTSRAVHSK